MNEKIKQLKEQARDFYLLQEDLGCSIKELYELVDQKFAEMIVKECVKECQQEWYDLNNAPEVENESIRGAGIRVGQKNGVLKCISKIKQHFGVEE
jgi:hypothetical protein